ncbi:MAG: acyl-ACP--UDP-N-acetylglucosamine O-acyltransferase [Planctomycetota bacterium]|nr:acyl-ACP--UDP-N-acetylglucosamine O-acyltransferase [Planctomycetota bacterium]
MNIHPLAIVSPQAHIGEHVTIGPFAVIEADVVIGDGCTIAAHCVIKNGTTLGPNNEVHESAVIGGFPQHLKRPQQLGRLEIGAGNTIREHTTIHRAMKPEGVTYLGDENLMMAGAHVAHDCTIGNNVVLANNVMLAGHVSVEDRAFISGGVGIHQFCRVGRLAMVGGMARIVQDVPPFVMIDGNSNCVVGLNLVGLRRNGFSADEVAELKRAYRVIYRSSLKWNEILETLQSEFTQGTAVAFYEFFQTGKRGFVQERRVPPGATIKLRPTADDADTSMPAAPAASMPEYKSKAG